MNDLLTSALKLLPIVGPVVAAAPEFVELYRKIEAGLGSKDQAALKAALAKAQDGSAAAHADLQKLVAERS